MTQSPLLFPGINSNAEMYFAGATVSNSAAASVVTDISLSTPYLATLSTTTTANGFAGINLPSTGILTQSEFSGLNRKRAAADPTSSVGGYDTSEADYGYVDPFFISFLAQNPSYQKQYPQLAGCFPGGPSIDPGKRVANLVSTPTLELSLTGTTSTTDYISGCFNTDSPLCATAAAPKPTALPEVASTPANPQPAPRPPQASATSVIPPQVPSNPPSPPIQPASPSYNPKDLSPTQLSQLPGALQPTPGTTTPELQPIQPALPSYNPKDLSPTQLSQLLGALQPTPGTTTPEPSPVSPPPPTSLGLSLSPPVIASDVPMKSTSKAEEPTPTPLLPSPPTSLQTSLSPPVLASVTPSESATSAAGSVPTATAQTSVLAFPGEAGRSKGKPLWSLLSLCLGSSALALL